MSKTSNVKRQAGLAAATGSARSSKAPIKKRGVLIPADNSFEAINRFVNCYPSPQYEELQWALLGIATQHEKLESALKRIANCETQVVGLAKAIALNALKVPNEKLSYRHGQTADGSEMKND